MLVKKALTTHLKVETLKAMENIEEVGNKVTPIISDKMSSERISPK